MSGAMTLGEFLFDKFNNMLKWLEMNGIDKPSGCSLLNSLIVTKIVEELRERHLAAIKDRDMNALLLAHDDERFQAIMRQIIERPELHEKFWRYMDLFVTVIAQSLNSDDGSK